MIFLSIADLVGIMHDIDAAKGRVCRDCRFGWVIPGGYGDGMRCRNGHNPGGPQDGCD